MQKAYQTRGPARNPEPDELLRQLLGEAIESHTEPEYGDAWRSPLWDIARAVKKHPPLAGADGFGAWNAVCRVIAWEDLAEVGSLGNEDDTCAAFVSAWDAARYAEGETLLSIALARADCQPTIPRVDHGRRFQRFVSLIVRLGEMVEPEPDGGRVVAIPQAKFAELLGVERNTIATWIKWTVTEQIIKVETEYSRENRRARRYRLSTNGL
jgi:hypothetical protein